MAWLLGVFEMCLDIGTRCHCLPCCMVTLSDAIHSVAAVMFSSKLIISRVCCVSQPV